MSGNNYSGQNVTTDFVEVEVLFRRLRRISLKGVLLPVSGCRPHSKGCRMCSAWSQGKSCAPADVQGLGFTMSKHTLPRDRERTFSAEMPRFLSRMSENNSSMLARLGEIAVITALWKGRVEHCEYSDLPKK